MNRLPKQETCKCPLSISRNQAWEWATVAPRLDVAFIVFLQNDLTCNFPPLAHNWGVMWQQRAGFFFLSPCLPCQLSTPDIGRIRFDSSSWGLAIGRAPGTLCLKRGIHHHGVWEQEKQSIHRWDTQAPLEIEACLETSGWGEGGWKGPSEGIRRWEVKVWVLTATQTLRRDTRFRTQRAGDSVNQPAEKGLHSTALSDLKDSVALRVKCSVALLWKMAVIRGWKYVLF